MKEKNTMQKKLILMAFVCSMLLSTCLCKEICMASAARIPEGYTMLYSSKEPSGNNKTDDEYYNTDNGYNWMDVDLDDSHLQITPMSEVPEGYTPIRDIDDLYGINDNPTGKYILMNDIDLSKTSPGGEWDFGNGWKPIKEFYGTFEGNGYRIMNMTIYGTADEENFFGLFGTLAGGASIRNLGLVNINIDITSTSEYSRLNIGGIAGGLGERRGFPKISRCFVTGTISSQSDEVGSIGGIVGYSENVEVRNCYTNVNISAKRGGSAGGITGCWGYQDGNGTNYHCYAAGSISGEFEYLNMVGGSYSEECYYLKTNGKDAYADGLSQAQMEKERCYTGFDFEKIWYMDTVSGYSYPQLRNCPQARVSSCELTTLPRKLAYTMNEIKDGKLDLSGGVLTLIYEDGVKAPVELESSMISEIYAKKDDKQAPVKVFLHYLNEDASFDVAITEVIATGLKLSQTRCQLNRGESVQIIGSIEPANAVNGSLTWETSNELVATVSANGTVKGLNAGTAEITASTDNGITASCTVTVNVPAKKIKLSVSKLTLKKGQKKKITAVMTPLDATDTITWISSQPKIVKVNSNGLVTAKKKGSATIMAKSSSGKRAYVKITVK